MNIYRKAGTHTNRRHRGYIYRFFVPQNDKKRGTYQRMKNEE
jgi:hypothetical protein